MNLTGKNMIGCELSGKGERFHSENPSTREILYPGFFEATTSEINTAIEKAAKAFPIYRNKTAEEKGKFLEAIAAQLLGLGDQLIKKCAEETGLPEVRLIGERGRTIAQLKLFAQLLYEGSWVDARIDTADPTRTPLPKPDVRSMQRPIGPVGIFGASNFPLAFSVAGGDTVSALAAGCPVVVKAHPAHPGTCELVGNAILRAAQEAGIPDGVFSLLHGKSTNVGQSIVKNLLIKAIGFTGSFMGGKALFDEANKREEPIPVYAEMGSVNPVFVLPGALKEKNSQLAMDLATSVTQGVGQFCTNPGLIVVEKSSGQKEFRSLLMTAISKASPGVMLSKGISNNFYKGLEKLKAVQGVKVAAMGKLSAVGYSGTPAILEADAGIFLQEHLLEEEVFGPSTLLVTASNRQELLAAAKRLSGHLTATVHGTEKDLHDYAALIDILEQKVGRLIINGYPTGVEVCHSMVHGGPFPATTDCRSTSVGTRAILRFTRPVCYQNFPQSLLPSELKDSNPQAILRMVNGKLWRDALPAAVAIHS
jgi:alpha-ketoglutaric semialdehyde dehydrogenase